MSKMVLNYKLKAVAFWLLCLLPRSAHLYLSKHVTKRAFRNFDKEAQLLAFHKMSLSKLASPVSELVAYEFGAGKDLMNAYYMRRLGVGRLELRDLNPLLDLELCARAAEHFGFGAIRDHKELRQLGIRYVAPSDASASDLADASIDFCYTTNVLEHVPPSIVPSILADVYRVLKPGAICSFIIDHTDHYSHSDPSIPDLNFLQFSEMAWFFLNPPNHYQNRLQPNCFQIEFHKAGFEIVLQEQIEAKHPPQIIADEFKSLATVQRNIAQSKWTLRKPS